MCGFVFQFCFKNNNIDIKKIKNANDLLIHRGPDHSGYVLIDDKNKLFLFTDEKYKSLHSKIDSIEEESKLLNKRFKILFSHRRLSIVDKSINGHQPMIDKNTGVILVYNGEIYNYKYLKDQIGDNNFTGESDTEVVLRSYIKWGYKFIKKLNGMFSFVIWDPRTKKILVGRDRYGIKPLYYYQDHETLIVSSEIKPIKLIKENLKISCKTIDEYFTFQNIFSDNTFYEKINELAPGNFLIIDNNGFKRRNKYWDFHFESFNSVLNINKIDIIDLLTKSIELQSDTTERIGCHLSAGIDSSLIASILAEKKGSLSTFTAGFEENKNLKTDFFNEIKYSERLSRKLKSKHFNVIIKPEDIFKSLDNLIHCIELPRMGQSYPNYLLNNLVGKKVRIVYSGLGSDELFGGYPWRYRNYDIRKNFVETLYSSWQRIFSKEEKKEIYQPSFYKKILNDVNSNNIDENSLHIFKGFFKNNDFKNKYVNLSNIMYFECKTFLKGVLSLEDKISMSKSIEMRLPYLDNDLVDNVCKIPTLQKLDPKYIKYLDENRIDKKRKVKLEGKFLFKNVSKKYLDNYTLMLNKQGFSFPDESWFENECQKLLEKNLYGEDSELHHFFQLDKLRNVLNERKIKNKSNRLTIWSLLSFNSWIKNNNEIKGIS